jgi:hypothetical protein
VGSILPYAEVKTAISWLTTSAGWSPEAIAGGRDWARAHPEPEAQLFARALIIIETSSSTFPSGMLLTQAVMGEEEDGAGDATPKGTQPTVASLDMPGPWSVCLGNRAGELLPHRPLPATPESFLQARAPYRQALGVAVACLLTWYRRADLGAHAGLPCVLGHAQSRQALHGGNATPDRPPPTGVPCSGGAACGRRPLPSRPPCAPPAPWCGAACLWGASGRRG